MRRVPAPGEIPSEAELSQWPAPGEVYVCRRSARGCAWNPLFSARPAGVAATLSAGGSLVLRQPGPASA